MHNNVVRILQNVASTTILSFFFAHWNFGFIPKLQHPLALNQEATLKFFFFFLKMCMSITFHMSPLEAM